MKELRISAAAIIIHKTKLLLVKYNDKDCKTFLVGPGGGVKVEESLTHGLKREVWEETRLEVQPGRILLVEDLLSQKYRLLKIWFLCSIIGGQLEKTPEAQEEGIIDVNWYTKEQLVNQTVYPSIIMGIDWKTLINKDWETQYLDLKHANF